MTAQEKIDTTTLARTRAYGIRELLLPVVSPHQFDQLNFFVNELIRFIERQETLFEQERGRE